MKCVGRMERTLPPPGGYDTHTWERLRQSTLSTAQPPTPSTPARKAAAHFSAMLWPLSYQTSRIWAGMELRHLRQPGAIDSFSRCGAPNIQAKHGRIASRDAPGVGRAGGGDAVRAGAVGGHARPVHQGAGHLLVARDVPEPGRAAGLVPLQPALRVRGEPGDAAVLERRRRGAARIAIAPSRRRYCH
jgi:hypothetical protein